MPGSTTIQEYYEGQVEPIYRAIAGAILHLGIFQGAESRETATERTKAFLASHLELGPGLRVADLGSGYADTARFLASRFGCRVLAINLVHSQNVHARSLNERAGLQDRVFLIEGDFARTPLSSALFQVVWSQEAFLHAPDRAAVIREAARLLEPGGNLIFTDLLQTGLMEPEEARLIFERVHIQSLETFDSYARHLAAAGLTPRAIVDLSNNVAPSYQDHVDTLREDRSTLEPAVGKEFLEYTIQAMERWVRAGREGKLGWGMFLGQKR